MSTVPRPGTSKAVDADAVAAMMSGGGEWALLDIREYAEADRGRILAATVLPRRLVEFRVRSVVPRPACPIVLYDDGGFRAFEAARTLGKLGYQSVHVMAGGLPAWQRSGHPVVAGLNVRSKLFAEMVAEGGEVDEVSAAELWRLLHDDAAVLVDVRPRQEYVRGYVPRASNVPGVELARQLDALTAHTGTVVTTCAGRTRGIVAALALRTLGAKGACVLRDGIQGWMLAGHDLEIPSVDTAVVDSPPPSPPPPPYPSPPGRPGSGTKAWAEDLARVSPGSLAGGRGDGSRTTYVFDVRTRAEFARSCVEGAVWAAGGQLVQQLDDYAAVQGGSMVLVDSGEEGDARAELTAYLLGRMGVGGVSVLDGGMQEWIWSGHRAVGGRHGPGPDRPAKAERPVVRVGPGELHASMCGPGAPLVVDVDTSLDYTGGHIPESVWVLRSWLERDLAGLADGSDRPIVLVCHHGGAQSELAAGTLGDLGYRNVAVLDGGMAAWRSAGLPTEDGPEALRCDPPDIVLAPHERGEQAMHDYLGWERSLTALFGRPGSTEHVWSIGRPVASAAEDPGDRRGGQL